MNQLPNQGKILKQNEVPGKPMLVTRFGDVNAAIGPFGLIVYNIFCKTLTDSWKS